MNKLSICLEAILLKNGGTPQDWRDLVNLVNSRPEE